MEVATTCFLAFCVREKGLAPEWFCIGYVRQVLSGGGYIRQGHPAGLSDHVRAPETIQQLQATNQQVEPGGQQTPAPRQQDQAPRLGDLSADLLAELNRVGLLLGTARRGSAGQ